MSISTTLPTGNALSRRPVTWGLQAIRGLDLLSPVIDLALRIWVATAFFKSGLTKIESWDSTLFLFANEYHVPLLPSELAAYLGTAAELSLPILLVLGLGGRFAAAALLIFNIIAVISYPDPGEVGLRDHQVWGLMLLVTLLHGPGRVSIDHLLRRWVFAR
jgi:putative oxidoreductase